MPAEVGADAPKRLVADAAHAGTATLPPWCAALYARAPADGEG